MNLKPCPFRHASEEGHILCDKIKTGDKQVSPNICRDCPISAINCSHLRATLDHTARLPITVRYGNGRTEVWDDVGGPAIKLERAACAAKVIPINSARECASCALRQALITPEMITNNAVPKAIVPEPRPTADRRKSRPASPQPVAPPAPVPVAQQNTQPEPTPEKRENMVAQKIILLQEWLAKQKNISAQKPEEENDSPAPRPIVISAQRPSPRPPSNEEKRVGWTD